MISGYAFSKQGISHRSRNIPCQDSSVYFKLSEHWHLIAVADGVGSCKHSDIASQIAVDTLCRFIGYAFPFHAKEEDLISLLRTAFHASANFVEKYVIKKGETLQEYHTTLCAAIYNDSGDLYYANAGDSGIIALGYNGIYQILSQKSQNEYGEVYPLSSRRFEIGKADFRVAAAACLTDGLLDWIVPDSLSEHKFKVYVPRARIIINHHLFERERQITEKSIALLGNTICNRISVLAKDFGDGKKEHEQYGFLSEGNLLDDLSAAVVINTDAPLNSEHILWEEPTLLTVEQQYLLQYRKFKAIYKERAEKPFLREIMALNPQFDADKIEKLINSIHELDKGKGTKREEAKTHSHTKSISAKCASIMSVFKKRRRRLSQ